MCAVPPNLPIDAQGVDTPPGAGPYYFSSKEKGSQIILRKNPYYGGKRRQNWDVVRVVVEMGEQASYLQVRKGEADLDLYSIPVAAHSQLTKEFGINKGRYFVNPANTISYLALNTSRGIFKDPKARQAVAYAVNRPALMSPGRRTRRARGASGREARSSAPRSRCGGRRDTSAHAAPRPSPRPPSPSGEPACRGARPRPA